MAGNAVRIIWMSHAQPDPILTASEIRKLALTDGAESVQPVPEQARHQGRAVGRFHVPLVPVIEADSRLGADHGLELFDPVSAFIKVGAPAWMAAMVTFSAPVR
ncbi:MAG: hypothetical protein ACRYG8_06385 [Janthinobacterium lividum]